MLLSVDTSTLTASAAVVTTDGVARAEARCDPGTPTDQLLALCERALSEAAIAPSDLTAIAVGAGPGSFTGLRIGMATAKGLAYALGRPLWMASSLAALAHDLAAVAPDDDGVLVAMLDARRGEIYAAAFRRSAGGLVPVLAECVVPPDALIATLTGLGAPLHLAGDALEVHAEALASLVATRHPHPRTPSALGVARAALAGSRVDRLHDGAPAYIRPSEAEVKFPDGVPGALPAAR